MNLAVADTKKVRIELFTYEGTVVCPLCDQEIEEHVSHRCNLLSDGTIESESWKADY